MWPPYTALRTSTTDKRCALRIKADSIFSQRVEALPRNRSLTVAWASFSPPARRAAFTWLLCGLVLSGCAGLNPAPYPNEKTSYVYRVGAGDMLMIEVWKEPGLEEREVTVTPDGHIAFPLVSGSIEVMDSTLS